MRHRHGLRKLNRTSSHRLAMFRNLANALIQHENFHGTPHIGAATLEAQHRVGIDIAKAVIAALSGEKPSTLVNAQYLN